MRRAAPRSAPAFAAFVAAACSSATLAYADVAVEKATDSLGGAIRTAAVAAIIGAVGWIVAYVLNGRREERTRRLQLTIKHASDATVAVRLAAIEGKPSDEEYALSGLIYSKSFLPIHEEINAILKSKIQLQEG